jgi:hypothetical protein
LGADDIVCNVATDSTIHLSEMMSPITDTARLTIHGETATNLTISGDVDNNGQTGDGRVSSEVWWSSAQSLL